MFVRLVAPFFLLLKSVPTLSVTRKLNTDFIVHIYENAAPIYCSLKQNPYFTIPFTSSQILEGFFPMDISTPPMKDTFIRELTGFYKARRSGKHLFSTGVESGGTIQLGARDDATQIFSELILSKVFSFAEGYASFDLVEGKYYPIRVTVFSGLKMVPIYVSDPNGISNEINLEIMQVFYDQEVDHRSPNGTLITLPIYYGAGFYTRAYLCPGKPNRQWLTESLSAFHMVHDGYFDTPDAIINAPMTTASTIIEIFGHFKPPIDGRFSLCMGAGVQAVIQIGPGNGRKAHHYLVTSEWYILDPRFSNLLWVDFLSRLFYPFRVVIFGSTVDLRSDLIQLDPNGKVVDLFLLWLRTGLR